MHLPTTHQGLLEPDAGKPRPSGSEGAPAQQCAGATRQIESAYYALRHTLLGGRVLRCKDPAGIEQEMWALLLLYQAIRHAMVTAIETQPGTDPDRAGFTIALETARDTVTTATGILPNAHGDKTDLVGYIGAAVLTALLPPRRLRYSVRTVKCGISRYHTWNHHTDTRPLTSTAITAVDITVTTPNPPTPQPAPTPTRQPRSTPATPTRRHRRRTSTPAPPKDTTRPPDRWHTVAALLRQTPSLPRRGRDIARTLGITGEQHLNSFCVQMSTWARRGRLTKTAPATYTIKLALDSGRSALTSRPCVINQGREVKALRLLSTVPLVAWRPEHEG
jgi:hypothetical protein